SAVVVRHGFRSCQLVNHAPYYLDTLQKIVNANVFVRPVRIRSGIAGPERRHRRRWLRHTTHSAHWSTRRIHRIDERRLAMNFSRRLNHRTRNTRLRRRLRQWRTSELDDLDISKPAHIEMFA